MIPEPALSDLLTRARDAQVRRSGGNSTVAQLAWNGRQVAVKDYNARADAVTRLKRETEGLKLLWSSGLRMTPEPLGADFASGFGVQEWLPGTPPTMGGETVAAMETSLRSLHEMAGSPNANASGQRAADAIREVADMRVQVLQRSAALERLECPRLVDVLNSLAAVVQMLDAKAGEIGGWVPTLSPSDFGPHNMLHDAARNDWRLIDLEFFGWDDAHKLTCDTLMHPLIQWDGDLAGRFFDGAADIYGLDPGRLMALYPWCSLKWTTIVANRVAREIEAGRLDQAEGPLAMAHSYLVRAIESSRLERDITGLETLLRWEFSQ